MDSLTKENFWNALYEACPSEIEQFCKWIDEYKKRVNWNKLFNSDSDYQNAQGKNAPAPKYHELPIAMQLGIFTQFAFEHGGTDSHTFINDDVIVSMNDFVDAIKNYFRELHAFGIREMEAGENFEE